MYQYELTFNLNIVRLAKLARTHRLFVPGWTMTLLYSTWVDFPESIMYNDRMALAYHNNIPVGASTFTIADKRVMVFVRKKYRRNKIGTNLVRLITTSIDDYDYDFGNKESLKFWFNHDQKKHIPSSFLDSSQENTND